MKRTYQGQILIITLLVLTIIAVIIVGIVGIATRDVQQTVANRKYEELLNNAELNVVKLLDKYADTKSALTQLVTEYPSNCRSILLDEYECRFTDQNLVTVVNVEDSSTVNDYELKKDGSLELQLNGFRDEVSVYWEGLSAMEFSLFFTASNKQQQIIDVFDLNAIYDSVGNDPLNDLAPQNHAFPFVADAAKGTGWYKFNIAGVTGLPADATTHSLRITSRQPDNSSVKVLLDVQGSAGFPDQVREFTATSFDNAADVHATARVRTVVPILAQVSSVFNYLFGVSEGAVIKQ